MALEPQSTTPMATTINKPIKVWLLEPGRDKISVKRVPVEVGSHNLDCYYELLECRLIERYSFTDRDTGKCYVIYFDEEALMNGSRTNECAIKLFRSVTRWTMLKGKIMVFCETHIGAGPSADMDITPQHFVKLFKKFLTSA